MGVTVHLGAAEPFDEIFLMLFSHGVDSVGLVPIDRWRAILRRSRRRGDFLGVDERAYPRDFATFARYHTDVPRKIAARYPLPGPLTLRQLDSFLGECGDRYQVRWLDHLPNNGVMGRGVVSGGMPCPKPSRTL